jgi:DNA polymerase III subunit delta
MSLPPIAILHGEDDFEIAERVTALKAAMGDPSTASLNTTELDGKTVSFTDLRGICDAMPFLSEKRLVIVRGLLTRLTGRAASDEDEDDDKIGSALDYIDELVNYFDSFPDFTSLVLVEPKAINERSRILKSAGKLPGAEITKLDVPQGAQLSAWIAKRAKVSGGQFAPAAAEALASAVGDEPRALANEIDKLLAFVNWERPVDIADVEKLTPATGEAIIWDLVDAMGARNAQLSLNKYHTLLAMPSQDSFAIFGMIVRQFRLLLQAKEVVDKGGNVNSVVQALQLKGTFQAEKYVKQGRNFSMKELETVYRRLLDLDLALKSGSGDDTTAMDTFIAALASR